MVKPKTSIILVTALLFLSSVALAQDSGLDDVPEEPETELGEGVLAYNFVMRGLPASDGEEVDVERSFEVDADDNDSFSISQEEAVQTALDELGSSEWELEEAERSEGLYELTFVRGESEAEVSVDGSTGTIVELDAEVEYEPLEEPSAVLSGFVQFSNDRFELDTDIEVNEEENRAQFEVEIEEDGDMGSDVVTRESIREFEDAEPGEYTGVLEVIRADEVVHTEEQEFTVPSPEENDSESEDGETEDSNETEEESEDEEQSLGLEEMSRQQLVDEIRDLREEVERLRNQASDRGPEEPPTPGDDSEENEENESDEDESEDEDTEDSESEESEDSNESEGPPTGAPGNSENRPGFVNRMLSGLFG